MLPEASTVKSPDLVTSPVKAAAVDADDALPVREAVTVLNVTLDVVPTA